ncbi:hypothetical protein TorRG33x02_005050, partial [Trema orientale]
NHDGGRPRWPLQDERGCGHHAQSCSVGLRAIIRNAKGEVMAILIKKVTGTLSAKNAKAKVLAISLVWARVVGLNLQFLESNILTVV